MLIKNQKCFSKIVTTIFIRIILNSCFWCSKYVYSFRIFLIPYGISLSGRNCSLIVCKRLVNVLFFNEILSEFYIQKWPISKLSLIHPRCMFFVENGIKAKEEVH